MSIHLHNIYGLGDSVFNLILFFHMKQYLEDHNITILYYAKTEYIHQLNQFINSKNVILDSLSLKPDHSIHLWIDDAIFKPITFGEYMNHGRGRVDYNRFYIAFFNHALKKINMDGFILHDIIYHDHELIERLDRISDKYKQFDILILNSQPFSGQYNYNKDRWNDHIQKMNTAFKIVTTTKVDGVLCTFDDKLSVKDIAALSSRAKIVIAINSGVFPGLLNSYTISNVKHFYIFDIRCFYSYPNFTNLKNCITDITFDELKQYI